MHRAKLRLALMLFFSLAFGAVLHAQTPKASIDATNTSIADVLKSIEKQTDCAFFYNNADFDASDLVSVKADNESVDRIISRILPGMRCSFENKKIILTKAPESGATSRQESGPKTVTGVIVDNYGEPIIGAAVMVKGTTTGAVTDFDGRFTLDVDDASEDTVLEVSCLGYTSTEFTPGNRSYFEVTLLEESILMEGTVITALGIKRSEKALSYNVQKVDADAILSNKDANFINSLDGKVAGLVINASSSGVGGATKVVMRGAKSISKSSNALYVIDGVPMYTSARDADSEFGSRGATDPIADINPEDIESMSVLTGAAAAALYGSAAANGAIVVTTKRGLEGKTSVTFTSNSEISNPFILPRFQNRYGTGDYSSSSGSVLKSWGSLLNSSNYYGYNPRSDYFETGLTTTETVSLSTGNSKNQTYLSVAVVNSDGIIPNNEYNRYNFSFRNTTKFLDDKMTLEVGATYVIQNDLNMTNQGLYNNPIVGAYLFPRGDDWNDIKVYERYDSSRKIYTQYWPVGDGSITMQNPYWINYRNLRQNKKNRYMLNASLAYEVLDWITVSGRVSVDNSSNKYEEKYYATTNTQLTSGSDNGYYGIENQTDKQFYADALVDINKSWGDWSLHGNFGASITHMKQDYLSVAGPIASESTDEGASNIPNVFNVFALSATQTDHTQSGWQEETQSVYGSAEIGWKGTYYLTLTGRNDWPSQLAGANSANSCYFYWSAGGSAVISQIWDFPQWLEYMKLRVSYASVGSPFERFVANPSYEWPDGGSAWATQTTYPLYNLKPERTNSWEFGLSARFLNWFNVDASYYNTHTLNQTIYPEISTGSGYSEIPIQTGDVLNEGFELSLGFEKQWGDFTWSSNYTFSTNRNKIVSLAENVTNPATGEKFSIDQLEMGGLGNARFILKEGGSLGDLYSRCDLVRDDNGDIYVDADGNVSSYTITSAEDYIKLGSVLPKANMSWRNDFKWRNFSLGAQISARIGGIVYSRTQAYLDYYGVSEASAAARDAGGVLINGGDLVDANMWYTAIGSGDTVPQYYTYSATNVRLKEVSFGYTIPRKALRNVCDVTLQVTGTNLWMIYNKAPFDPESIATTDNYYQGIDYFMMPGTRRFGFNVRLKF